MKNKDQDDLQKIVDIFRLHVNTFQELYKLDASGKGLSNSSAAAISREEFRIMIRAAFLFSLEYGEMLLTRIQGPAFKRFGQPGTTIIRDGSVVELNYLKELVNSRIPNQKNKWTYGGIPSMYWAYVNNIQKTLPDDIHWETKSLINLLTGHPI